MFCVSLKTSVSPRTSPESSASQTNCCRCLKLIRSRHPVLGNLPDPMHGYFVHSYHLKIADPRHRLAVVDYGGAVAAVVGRDNLIGTQFHPEKSQGGGLLLIANFLRWRP